MKDAFSSFNLLSECVVSLLFNFNNELNSTDLLCPPLLPSAN